MSDASTDTVVAVSAHEPLTADMYDDKWDRTTGVMTKGSKRFGLRCGAIRSNEIAHNANWFNADGDSIGWGDLTGKDMTSIATGLTAGEMFLVAAERIFWDPIGPPKRDRKARKAVAAAQAKSDGTTHRHATLPMLAQHLRFVITPGQIRVVSNYNTPGTAIENTSGRFDYGDTPVTYMSSAQAVELIKATRKAADVNEGGVIARLRAKFVVR